MCDREFWTPTATSVVHRQRVLHHCDWCFSLLTCVAHLQLVLQPCDWCPPLGTSGTPYRVKLLTGSPNNFNKYSNLGGPSQSLSLQSSKFNTEHFIHHKNFSQCLANIHSTLNNSWQSPHERVGYNLVPQWLPNHTQPMGRCQKKLKEDWSADQSTMFFFNLHR